MITKDTIKVQDAPDGVYLRIDTGTDINEAGHVRDDILQAIQVKGRLEEFFNSHKQIQHEGVKSDFCPWCELYRQLIDGEKK